MHRKQPLSSCTHPPHKWLQWLQWLQWLICAFQCWHQTVPWMVPHFLMNIALPTGGQHNNSTPKRCDINSLWGNMYEHKNVLYIRVRTWKKVRPKWLLMLRCWQALQEVRWCLEDDDDVQTYACLLCLEAGQHDSFLIRTVMDASLHVSRPLLTPGHCRFSRRVRESTGDSHMLRKKRINHTYQRGKSHPQTRYSARVCGLAVA